MPWSTRKKRWYGSVDEAWITIWRTTAQLLAAGIPCWKKKGVEKVYVSRPKCWPDSKPKLPNPAREAWIKDMEAQGIPGQELYDLVYQNTRRKTRV